MTTVPPPSVDAREQPDRLVVGGQRAAVEVHRLHGLAFGAVVVVLGVVAAGFDHDHVEPGPGEHGRGDRAAGPEPTTTTSQDSVVSAVTGSGVSGASGVAGGASARGPG